jgi:hypothetical protein
LWSFFDAVPYSHTRTGSSSHELRIRFRVRIHLSAARHSHAEHSPRVFRPLRDINTQSPLTTSFPRSSNGPPSAFLTLSTVCSSAYLAGLFHPTATYGILTSGVFPATLTSHLSATRLPHDIRTTALLPSCLVRARLQPPAFRDYPGSDPLYRHGGLKPCRHPIPSCVFNSLGFFSENLGNAFTSPPFMTFSCQRYESTNSWPSTYQSVFDLSLYL